MKTMVRFARANGIVGIALVLSVCAAPRAWSLDGARVVFGAVVAGDAKHARRLFVTTPKGAGLEELPAGSPWANEPAWSNDGRSIAFSHSPQWLALRTYVMDADGGNLRGISNAPFPYAVVCRFSGSAAVLRPHCFTALLGFRHVVCLGRKMRELLAELPDHASQVENRRVLLPRIPGGGLPPCAQSVESELQQTQQCHRYHLHFERA